MKKLLQIGSDDVASAQPVLCMKLGEKYFAFAIVDKSSHSLRSLQYYTTDKISEEKLEEVISTHPELKEHYDTILVCYDFPHSVLMPANEDVNVSSHELINVMCGQEASAVVLTDELTEWNIQNSYTIPESVAACIKNKFRSATTKHLHSVLLQGASADDSKGLLLVDVKQDDISLLVIKNDRLLLAQEYEYSTPEDILYHLLRACEEFSLSQEEVQLQLSGLIEKQSVLFTELYQYFILTSFREATWKVPQNDYPMHYFTSLNDLALCAS